MEPYRTSGFRCPVCSADTPLREFHDRLVCDECHGFFMDEGDFVSSCADLANRDLELQFSDASAVTKSCPRCERALAEVRVTLHPIDVKASALRCERHGLWFTNKDVTALFARVSRRTGSHGGAYYAMGPRVGLDGLPTTRHAPASHSLAISDWRNRRRRRTPTASPVNLYRDQVLACPTCAATGASNNLRFFGDRYQCEHCTGTFVQNAALESMVHDVSNAPWDLPAPAGGAGPRACPVCSEAMVVEDLEDVPIDRCASHGVWFDTNELAVLLERASGQFDPRGLRAWLTKLFTRGA